MYVVPKKGSFCIWLNFVICPQTDTFWDFRTASLSATDCTCTYSC